MRILAIDPGNIESAYVVLDENLKPLEKGKIRNEDLRIYIIGSLGRETDITQVTIEMVACYGMPVGKEVFDTCVWIGRFYELVKKWSYGAITPIFIYRKEEKMNLCGSMKAKDSNIRQALIDRFGIVGTKRSPGWFYGFKADIWSAYAVGVTYYDIHIKGGQHE